jgi:acetoacetate decarboxylase
MPNQGRLTPEKFGYSMPVDAPSYQRPPFYYRGGRSISVGFETDRDAALDVLPSCLTLSEPATAALTFLEYPWSTFGPYNEAVLSLLVEHKGRRLVYVDQIVVTTEPPMLAGREIWGYPKKLAHVEFRSERDMIFGIMERPAGVRLASAVVRPERPITSPHGSARTGVTLRLIPGGDANSERPARAELIETPAEFRIIEAWECTGSASFAEYSALDPWAQFPIRKLLGATYQVYDMLLPVGRILETI